MRAPNLTRRARLVAKLGLVGVLGCGGSLERMAQRGEHAAVVAEVESRRRPPSGRTARTYARSLVAQGKFERAREALLQAFRRGGDVPSLVALADLERDADRPSMAALHYARAFDLDPRALAGRPDVCSYFAARAAALVGVGEGRAAETFLRRSTQLCPHPVAAEEAARAALAQLIDAVARQEVAAEVERSRPPFSPPPAPAGERWSAEEIVTHVLAEGRGELGLDILPTHVLRHRIADQSWSDFAPVVMGRSESEQAYLQLRLAPVLASMPQAPTPFRGPREADIWVAKALELPGARTWRLLGWLGDLNSAELELRTALDVPRQSTATAPAPAGGSRDAAPSRPAGTAPGSAAGAPRGSAPDAAPGAAPGSAPGAAPGAAPGSAPGAPQGAAAAAAPSPAPGSATGSAAQAAEALEVPEHWSARVAEASPELLVVARLRAAAGRRELALRLARRHVRASERAEWAEDEATRALAWGDPWHALAIADAAAEPVSQALRAAMDTALALSLAVCHGPCQDAEDFEVVRTVMGDGWLQTHLQRLERPDAAAVAADALGCPNQSETLHETLVSAWRRRGPPRDALELTRALESEMVWACAGAWILPLIAAHPDPRAVATRWLDAVALASPLEGSTELSVAGRVAVLAGDDHRAELLLERAAATAMVPEQVLWDAVALAHDVKAFEIERWALHRLAIAVASPAKEVAQRELLVHAVRDAERSWAERETAHGREAVVQQIEETLAAVPEERRSSFRARLHARLRRVAAQERWAPERLRALGVESVDPEAATDEPSPWDDEALAEAATRGRTQRVPAVTWALGDPHRFEGLRLALAEGARDWAVRRRMAIGLVASGSAGARVRALAVLRELAGEAGRHRVDAVALAEAKVLVLGHAPAKAVRLFAGPDVAARVVFGLDLEPALVAPSGP